MANIWRGMTANRGYKTYNISTTLSDDITGEELLAALINDTNSNITMIDADMANASLKPSVATLGHLGQFDANRNLIDSGKSISPTVGNDDTTILHSKAIRDYVLQQQLAHTDYQGLFEYFGSQTQVEAVTAVAGESAIVYLGTQTNVTGIQKGMYDGTSWTFVPVSPAENNGMWIFAMKLLGEPNTPFGIAVYKNDGTNPISFDSAPFPMFRPDNTDITLDGSGDLTLTTKGTAGTYGEQSNKNLEFGETFKVLQQTTDTKGRTTAVNERIMTLPVAPDNGTSIYAVSVELTGEVGEIIPINVSDIQIPAEDNIILGQTLIVDSGFEGDGSGGTIGKVESYADAPANLIVNVKIVTKTGTDTKVYEATATLGTTWAGTEPPYTQTVSVAGMTAAMNPIVDVVLSDDTPTAIAQLEAWSMVNRITTDNGSITAFCFWEKPTVAVPIQLKAVI